MSRPRTRTSRSPVRRRDYILKVREVATVTTTDRQTLVTPSNGFRVRVVKIRAVRIAADDYRLLEIYFGTAANLITGPNKGIDILGVPSLRSASTRTARRGEGRVGQRNEVVSIRWRGIAPNNAHAVIIEYTEEP